MRRLVAIGFALSLVGVLLLPTATLDVLPPGIGKDIRRLGRGVLIYTLVKEFSDELNKFIQNLFLQKHAEVREATKVVPLISVGRGVHVGAAQVAGPEEALKKVRAVAQVEAKYQRRWRMHLYLPISTERPKGEVDKWVVKEVGVSALIDVEI